MALKHFPPAKRIKRVLRRKPRMPNAASAPSASSSNPLHAYSHAFRDWALATGIAVSTVTTRERAIARFIAWADERGITRPADITRTLLERYQRALYLHRKADGQPLSLTSQEALLNPLKAFFKWLVRDNHILANPASELILPRRPRQLPKTLLTVQQIEHVLNQPDVNELTGLRDRAVLEHLTLYDLDLAHGTLMIRLGKGGKDRLIPVGERACAWLGRYLDEVRPRLAPHVDERTLFLTDYGEPFEKNRVGDLVKRYMRHAGIARGSCHAFRHACATHMLENGADIRFIQVLLGHAELTTTQIYTQVSIQKLKEIHTATHPARLARVAPLASSDKAIGNDHGRHDRNRDHQ
jgi:integrase/recombinase XerD